MPRLLRFHVGAALSVLTLLPLRWPRWSGRLRRPPDGLERIVRTPFALCTHPATIARSASGSPCPTMHGGPRDAAPPGAHALPGKGRDTPNSSWRRVAADGYNACRSARRRSAAASLQILNGLIVTGAAAAPPLLLLLLPGAPPRACGGWRLALRACWAGECAALADIAQVCPSGPGAGAVRKTQPRRQGMMRPREGRATQGAQRAQSCPAARLPWVAAASGNTGPHHSPPAPTLAPARDAPRCLSSSRASPGSRAIWGFCRGSGAQVAGRPPAGARLPLRPAGARVDWVPDRTAQPPSRPLPLPRAAPSPRAAHARQYEFLSAPSGNVVEPSAPLREGRQGGSACRCCLGVGTQTFVLRYFYSLLFFYQILLIYGASTHPHTPHLGKEHTEFARNPHRVRFWFF